MTASDWNSGTFDELDQVKSFEMSGEGSSLKVASLVKASIQTKKLVKSLRLRRKSSFRRESIEALHKHTSSRNSRGNSRAQQLHVLLNCPQWLCTVLVLVLAQITIKALGASHGGLQAFSSAVSFLFIVEVCL